MKTWHILIHFIENFNDEMVLLTKILKPQQMILISNQKLTPESKLQQVLNYMKATSPQIKLEMLLYNEEEPLELKEKILTYLNQDVVINLAGISPLEALLIANLKEVFTMLYPDIKQNRLYIFEEGEVKIEVLSQVIGSLQVEDYLALGGGEVLQDERCKYETDLYKKMLQFLLVHYKDIFSKVRHLFKPTYLHFSAPYEKIFYFEIKSEGLTKEEKIALNKYLAYLKEINWIKSFTESEVSIRVYAQTKELEHYLSSGSWLEHVTYHYMKQIPEVSDVHTGFKFAWHMSEKYVHNELDVVATFANHLVCISCKDTEKYDYQTLNELEVYTTRLGGPESIKVLVTTMPPIKSSTLDRAKGMGIHIIQIENELGVLYDALKGVI